MQTEPVRLCRDENCDRLDLHLVHRVRVSKRKVEEPATEDALYDSIAKATSRVHPKPLSVIMRDIEYDYGSCCERTVQRRLKRMVSLGRVLQVDLGRRLFAYLHPESKLANDIELVREQVEMLVSTQ